MSIIERLLDKYILPNKHFQGYINSRFSEDGFHVVPDALFEEILNSTYYENNGFKYVICDQLDSIKAAATEYNLYDVKLTDTVLDIGANIGGFSIPMSRKVKHVYAVEPIFNDLLRRNIILNNVDNISVIHEGLGEQTMRNVKYGRRKRYINTLPLYKIINICGKVDILKLDCDDVEAELSIKPSELIGIRCIEAEIHHFDGMGSMDNFISALDSTGFEYTIEAGKRTSIIHAHSNFKK